MCGENGRTVLRCCEVEFGGDARGFFKSLMQVAENGVWLSNVLGNHTIDLEPEASRRVQDDPERQVLVRDVSAMCECQRWRGRAVSAGDLRCGASVSSNTPQNVASQLSEFSAR